MKESIVTWDANAWTHKFQQAVESKNYFLLNDLRTKVYENTLSAVNVGTYIANSGECVTLEKSETPIVDACFYNQEQPPDYSKVDRYETLVNVKNCDCLMEARTLVTHESVVYTSFCKI